MDFVELLIVKIQHVLRPQTYIILSKKATKTYCITYLKN